MIKTLMGVKSQISLDDVTLIANNHYDSKFTHGNRPPYTSPAKQKLLFY